MANLQRQKADQWLPWVGGTGWVIAKENMVAFRDGENILKFIVVIDAQLYEYIKNHGIVYLE